MENVRLKRLLIAAENRHHGVGLEACKEILTGQYTKQFRWYSYGIEIPGLLEPRKLHYDYPMLDIGTDWKIKYFPF